jgi:hypothetical protein
MLDKQLKKFNYFIDNMKNRSTKGTQQFPSPILSKKSNHIKSNNDSLKIEESSSPMEKPMLNEVQKNLLLKLLKKEHEKIKESSLADDIIIAHSNLIKSTVKIINEGIRVPEKKDISKMLEVDEVVDFDELVFSAKGKPVRRYRQKS